MLIKVFQQLIVLLFENGDENVAVYGPYEVNKKINGFIVVFALKRLNSARSLSLFAKIHILVLLRYLIKTNGVSFAKLSQAKQSFSFG